MSVFFDIILSKLTWDFLPITTQYLPLSAKSLWELFIFSDWKVNLCIFSKSNTNHLHTFLENKSLPIAKCLLEIVTQLKTHMFVPFYVTMKSITQVITSQSCCSFEHSKSVNKVGGRRFLELATKRVTHASSSKIGPFTTLGKPRGFLARIC